MTEPPFAGESADGGKQLFDLRGRQRRGRLVHDQDSRTQRERLRDFDHLLLSHAQSGDGRFRVDDGPERLQQRARPFDERAAIDDPGAKHRLAPEIDVLGGRQLRNEVEFLINRADADRLRFPRRIEHHRTFVDEDFPGIAHARAAEDFHQRGFAGTILPQQGVDFSAPQIEAHVVERHDARECFADATHLQQYRDVRIGWAHWSGDRASAAGASLRYGRMDARIRVPTIIRIRGGHQAATAET